MSKCRILVPVGCRSDEGLSAPIIKRLKQNENFEVIDINLTAGQFIPNYSLYFKNHVDIVFITGDRIEMTAAACWAFHNHMPIAHYFAGVLNHPISTLDDINRHCISLWSDIQFVESKICMFNLELLFQAIGKKPNCHLVGITHLEDLEIDISLVPKYSYDLVLYNPIKIGSQEEVKTILKSINKNKRKWILIGDNPDPYKNLFHLLMIQKQIKPEYYDNLPRAQFLGLLKWCSSFITNSSSAYYEAPAFLKPEQIVIVGDRNKKRTSNFHNLTPLIEGASNRIITQLEKWWKAQ